MYLDFIIIIINYYSYFIDKLYSSFKFQTNN